jgi:hypothetical protein
MLVGCKGASVQMTIPDNDTAKVLQVALRTAFFERKLPETGPLFAGNLFNDSILVDIDSFSKRLLPARLDTLKFKFGSYPQISALLSHIADSLKPNYLYICCFERTDSIYSVSVQSRSDVKFGGGGSMGIDIIKRADSFIVEHTYGNSIN